MKRLFRILGQILVLFLILLFSIFLINFSLPGNRSFCDNDQLFILYLIPTIAFVFVGYLSNSIYFLIKRHHPKFRMRAIIFCLALALAIAGSRTLVTLIAYGRVTHEIVNEEANSAMVKIRLFGNGKFISQTYDYSCTIENIGSYKLSKSHLELNFVGEKSDLLSTDYDMRNDTLTTSASVGKLIFREL